MQVSAGQYSLCSVKIPNPQSSSSSLFFSSKSCTHCYLLPSLVSKNIPIGKLQYCGVYETRPRKQRNDGAIYASEAGVETSTTAERWLLEPAARFLIRGGSWECFVVVPRSDTKIQGGRRDEGIAGLDFSPAS